MTRSRNSLRACAVLVVFSLMPAWAAAQARQNLTLARVIYNTRKATVKPAGELKEKIEALDLELSEATRLGRTGEVRRLLAKGMTLLAGNEWTDALEFSHSLVLRSNAVFIDSSKPYEGRLEQIYAPRLQLNTSLAGKVTLHKVQRALRTIEAGEKIKDLANLGGIGRDLRDEPYHFDLDLSGLEDGPYVLKIELSEKDRVIGDTTIAVDLRKDLDQRLGRIEAGLKNVKGFDALHSDVLYPLDYIRNVNRGRYQVGTFEIVKELSLAEEILASLTIGKDPFAGRTGDMERHYYLRGADEIMPYRVYVPTRYTGGAAYPLIIALHGLGATEDSFFDSYGRQFPKLAEERGYIVAAPLGYRVDGAYGASLLRSTEDESVRRRIEYSERDVLNVLALMKQTYKIDENRIYLTGHSMGAIGTWHLGAKYPEIWAALAPFAGLGVPANVDKMKHIPQIVVHGDADATVPVAGSRSMVAELKKLSVKHRYIEVPGGDHINVVAPNFTAIFDFFDTHRKSAP